MKASAKIHPVVDPALIAFVEALARARAKRDIAALRAANLGGHQGDARADGDLRTLQQR